MSLTTNHSTSVLIWIRIQDFLNGIFTTLLRGNIVKKNICGGLRSSSASSSLFINLFIYSLAKSDIEHRDLEIVWLCAQRTNDLRITVSLRHNLTSHACLLHNSLFLSEFRRFRIVFPGSLPTTKYYMIICVVGYRTLVRVWTCDQQVASSTPGRRAFGCKPRLGCKAV